MASPINPLWRRLRAIVLVLPLVVAGCGGEGFAPADDGEDSQGPTLIPSFAQRTLLMAPGQQRTVGLRIIGGAGTRDFDAAAPGRPRGAPSATTDVALEVLDNGDETGTATARVTADAAPGIHRLPIRFRLSNSDGSSSEVQDLVVIVLPTDAFPTAGSVAEVDAGDFHSLALMADGSVWAWGRNHAGQIGDGTLVDRQVPVPVQGLPGPASAIAAGGEHSLALLADGTVYGWGSVEFDQAALIDDTNAEVQARPVQLLTGNNAPVTGVIEVAAGERHSVALLNDGRVLVWGDNASGQLGSQFALGTSNRSNRVEILTGARAIAAGGDHVLALANDGTAWGWGRSDRGQLGGGVIRPFSANPIDIGFVSGVTGVNAGLDHTLLLLDDGNIGGLGANSNGQLGDGSLDAPIAQPTRPPNLLNVVTADGGWLHSLALQANRQVYAWGNNGFGQLSDSADPAPDGLGRQLQRVPQRVLALPPSAGIAAGGRHSLSIDDACGKVWSFGDNGNGQLGDAGSSQLGDFRASPLPVYGLGDTTANEGCRMLLSIASHGVGTVSVQPDTAVTIADADCARPCVTTYPRGTLVTLSATAGSGASFDGWYGNCAGSQSEIQVSMDRSRACLARFLQPPVARFTAETDLVDLGFDVLTGFDATGSTDPDGRIVQYEWDFDADGEFGDNDSTGDSRPLHTFSVLGSFDVALRVTDDDGLTNTATRTILVARGPTASASFAPEAPVAGETVSFDASSSSSPNGPIVSYEWDIGDDASIDGTGAVFQHVFDTAGEFEIRLRVRDNVGLDRTHLLTVVVGAAAGGAGEPPVAAFIAAPDPVEVGNTIGFDATASSDDGSIVSYEWDFQDDGSFDGSGALTEFVYTTPGSYTVRLRVTDDQGQTAETTLGVTAIAAATGAGSIEVVNLGGGDGQVFSVPTVVQCLFSGAQPTPSPCSGSIGAGQSVQVVAVAGVGFVFSRWGEGDCDSIGTVDGLAACTVSGPGARTVRVYFE